ncbi:MAG: hypothetical protein ACTSYA_03405 [Candidatus Kariarchaeaceae archaeon]
MVHRSQVMDQELASIKSDLEDYEVVEFISFLIDQQTNSVIMKEILKLDEAFFALFANLSHLKKEIALRKKN